jgi:hypothetical protein
MMAATRCARVRGVLSAYLDGELSPRNRTLVESHLHECATCAAELEGLKATSALIRDLPEAELPDDFHAILKRRVMAEAVAAGAVVRARRPVARRLGGLLESLSFGFRRWSFRGVAVTAALIVLVVWAGCFAIHMGVPIPGQNLLGFRVGSPGDTAGSGDGDMAGSKGYGDGGGGGPASAPDGRGYQDAAAAGGLGASVGTLGLETDSERKIVLYAYLTVASENVATAKDRAVAVVGSIGGFTESLTCWTDDKGTWASMLLRVPTRSLPDVMSQLTALGDVLTEQVSRQDVTSEHVDVTARLSNLRQQEQRLLVLVGRAQSLSDILILENELTRIRTEIERYERTLRSLDERVAFSTINLTLQPVAAGVKPGAGLWERIVDAFLQSIAWMGRLAESLVVFLARVAPAAVLIGLGWLAFVTVRSRRQKAGF